MEDESQQPARPTTNRSGACGRETSAQWLKSRSTWELGTSGKNPQVALLRFSTRVLLMILGSPLVFGCQMDSFWRTRPKISFPPTNLSITNLSEVVNAPPIRASAATIDLENSTQPAPLVPQADESETLQIDDVLNSVQETLPQLQALYQERMIAQGNLTSAFGAFDLTLSGQTVTQPLGFYESYRNSVSLSQNIMSNGSTVYGGYRLGRGSYPTWYKDRETNEGGELAVGTSIPLRRNRLIDSRRAAVFRAQQDLDAVQPLVRYEQNVILLDAKNAYWGWVGAGQALRTQRRLVDLAKERASVIAPLVERGDLPRLARIDNDRLIAQREAKFIESQRKFQSASIKLSLYLRDSNGQMLLADEAFLPEFPEMVLRESSCLTDDLQFALSSHPQLRLMELEIEKGRIDVADACNLVMGKLDGFAETSQDVGAPSSAVGDKSPLELQIGLTGEVPLQRRFGQGKLTAAQAKLRQQEWKQQFLANKIKIAIQDSYSAMENAYLQFLKARENVVLAKESLQIARRQFETGDIDLIVLNIYEQAVADAELNEIDAEIEFFLAESEYRFAMGQF